MTRTTAALLPLALLAAGLVRGGPAAALRAQDAPSTSDDEVQKLDKVDPFTDGDPEKMQALGVVRYGPFPWADSHTTADVDKVLGEGRVLWLETEHFRIGCNLATARLPDDSDGRKALQAECKELHRRLRAFPSRPKRLGPWVRLHLYAARCEQAYDEFLRLIGAAEGEFGPDRAYLGLPDKFLLLLFQKKSDMARYMGRFCNMQVDDSMRFYHDQSRQMLLCISAEGMEGFDEQGLHGHVLYGVWQNLMNGYNGYAYPLPLWLSLGVAHYYSRKVPTKFVNARIRDDESVDPETQNKWADKIWRRARHEGACFPFETIAGWSDWDTFGFHHHAQAWSRVDYLMHVDEAKVGAMLRRLKGVPPGGTFEGQGDQVRAMAPKLLFDLFELDGPTFDERWREWVLKTYPKRKD